MMTSRSTALGLAATVIALASCHDAPPALCDSFRHDFTVRDSMNQEVQAFTAGEHIFLESRITNVSASRKTLTAGSTCTLPMFSATDPAGNVAWNAAIPCGG